MINIHTHFDLKPGQNGLVNHSVLLPFQPKPGRYYSAGLHPWDLQQAPPDWRAQLEQLAAHPQVAAIGECGLDRSIETPLERQTDFLVPQTELAEKLGKPLVLHAVRCFSELMQLKRQCRSEVPWILHGYNGNAATSRQLLRQNFYFSIGPSLLKNNPKLQESLRVIPLSRLFFETDHTTEAIESIYIFAAEQLDLSIDELTGQLNENFQRIILR